MFSAPSARNTASSTTQRPQAAPFAADREPGFMVVKRSVGAAGRAQRNNPSSTTTRSVVGRKKRRAPNARAGASSTTPAPGTIFL